MEQELISELMDGELDQDHAERVLRGMRNDAEAVAIWTQYHRVGDILRGEAGGSPGLASRIVAALESEPTVLAPPRVQRPGNARRIALSMAASVAGVAVVGWLVLSNSKPAEVPMPGPVAADEIVRDLASVHQDFSSAMPGVASYIRTVGLRERDLAR